MSFNGFNQNNSGSDGRPPRKLFAFGASQGNSNSSSGFGNQVPNGNGNPGNLNFSNQLRPNGQNPGVGQTASNLFSFGSNSNNSLSAQPPQKMSFNFTNRSDSGRVVFKATAGTSTFRPPALVNSVRPRPAAKNSLGDMKFNLTWDPKASPERPVFPNNGMSLGSSSDHVSSNQRLRDNVFNNDNSNIRSMSCLTDMSPRPTIFNSTVPSSGLSANLPSTLSESSAPQNNTSSNPATPSIFTKSLLSQPPEARKNIFNFSKTNTASEIPKTVTSFEPSLVTSSNSEKDATHVSVTVSKPFEAPKFNLSTSLNEPNSTKPSSESGKPSSSTALPSIPAIDNSETKSMPTLFASSASQTTNAQIITSSVFNIPSKTEGSTSGGLFGFNSAKIIPNTELNPSKPINVTPSLPSLFSLSKFKSNTTQKHIDGDKKMDSLTTESFANPFLTKKSFSDPTSKNIFSAKASSSKRPFDNFDTITQSKKNLSEKTFNNSGSPASKELVRDDKSSKSDNVSNASTSFTSSLPASDTRALTKPISDSTLNTNQSYNSASSTSHERINKLNDSLITQVKNSMAKNPFKSLDELITLALNDKDKFLLISLDSNDTSSGLNSQGKGLDFGISKKLVANTKEINSKPNEVSSSNKFGKFNFSFENSSNSTSMSTSPNHPLSQTTSSPPKTKAFAPFAFSNQSDPKPTNPILNNKLAFAGTSNVSKTYSFQPTTQVSFGAQTSLNNNLSSTVAQEKDVIALSNSNSKVDPISGSSKPDVFSSQSSFSVTPLQDNSNLFASGSSPGSLSNSPKPLISFRSADSPVFSPKPYSPDGTNSDSSLGTTKTVPMSFPLITTGPTFSKLPSETNIPNSSIEVSSSNFRPVMPNYVISSQPSLKFDSTNSNTTEANPLFKFGLSGSNTQSSTKLGASQNPGLTPQPVFKFGLSDDNSPVSQINTFKPISPDPTKSSSPSSFKFGSTGKASVVLTGPGVNIPNTSGSKSTDNLILGASDSKSEPVFKIRSSDKSNVPHLGFNFGLSGTNATVSNNSQSNPADAKTQPAFKFGSSDKSSVPQLGFGFGLSGTNSTVAKHASSTGAQPQPVFKFGSSNTESPITQNSFAFGSSDGSKPGPSPTFKFGLNDSNKPVFAFGSSTTGLPSTPSFKFNTNSTLNTTPISNTTEPSGLAPISFFPKEQASAATPKLNLSFGLAKPSGDNAGFKFSLPNSTPSLNENSAAEPKSDSELDPTEEGFSGARTNDALIVRGQGEEEEASLIQLTIKLLAYDIVKKSYTDMGVGVLKVNQHNSTKKQRVVCRAEGSGRLLLNANLPAQSAEVIPKPRGVRLRINNLEGIPSMFVIRIRTDAEVEQFIDVLEGVNKAS